MLVQPGAVVTPPGKGGIKKWELQRKDPAFRLPDFLLPFGRSVPAERRGLLLGSKYTAEMLLFTVSLRGGALHLDLEAVPPQGGVEEILC